MSKTLGRKGRGTSFCFQANLVSGDNIGLSPEPVGAAEATFLYARGHSGSAGRGPWGKKIVPKSAGSLKCLSHSDCFSQEPKPCAPPTPLPAPGRSEFVRPQEHRFLCGCVAHAHTQLFCQPPCRLLSDPGTQCERAPLIRQTQALPGASPRAPGRQRPSREHLAECSACGRRKLEGSFGGG